MLVAGSSAPQNLGVRCIRLANTPSGNKMRHRHLLAATALLASSIAAHAEHFQYRVSLNGSYSEGGTEGCFPPDFDQPACPRAGSLSALLSFDTPGSADGSYVIEDGFGDITNFSVSLGQLQSATEALYGGVNLNNGIPNGTVQAFDESETFSFDWANRSASYSYDYGYHGANGIFTGSLVAVPEPGLPTLMVLGLVALLGLGHRRAGASRRRQAAPHAAKSGFSKPGLA